MGVQLTKGPTGFFWQRAWIDFCPSNRFGLLLSQTSSDWWIVGLITFGLIPSGCWNGASSILTNAEKMDFCYYMEDNCISGKTWSGNVVQTSTEIGLCSFSQLLHNFSRNFGNFCLLPLPTFYSQFKAWRHCHNFLSVFLHD